MGNSRHGGATGANGHRNDVPDMEWLMGDAEADGRPCIDGWRSCLGNFAPANLAAGGESYIEAVRGNIIDIRLAPEGELI
ncbi:hypothetical protein G6L94_02020 [Agrobacterium rhizogenes]|uniref:Uncharacterized protein n=2 Tax=Rhizobium rhizogenes TaxID=359 RepID=B9J709_RHIR8|nr:hypothetical protein Arad_0418 [Rhizobium rhizogenes K84]EJK85717.1 hypothetical protein PMI03_02062 [Rhizobium sp. AP16]KAA6487132.1 hypothetical protein DXT98_15945 [Agrobacterium sp. ICMP 7243]NTF46932.1 hypothetical protein [Rhizobium rhizogenes]OCJ21474.1 hypothetical protein A6U88_08885 [Agrobacterium sp. B131/95]OCJ27085.1 hypothetical protein A6U89_09375 [Agrobacterium sp. B133/95]GAJ94423.1 hypothetical protein RRH01S_08_01610 [Rhizobium rhizogenes NBRC 13257]